MKVDLPKLDFEFVLVNDGSPDNTWEVIKGIVNDNKNLKIRGVTYIKNCGKGYAVRTGMKFALGEYVLMVDADGATDVNEIKRIISEIKNLENQHNSKNVIVIGSRNQLKQVADRPFYRRLPSIVNNLFVRYFIGVKNILDTQCGFKMFTKESAKNLFSSMHLNRWAFDVELLYLAQK